MYNLIKTLLIKKAFSTNILLEEKDIKKAFEVFSNLKGYSIFNIIGSHDKKPAFYKGIKDNFYLIKENNDYYLTIESFGDKRFKIVNVLWDVILHTTQSSKFQDQSVYEIKVVIHIIDDSNNSSVLFRYGIFNDYLLEKEKWFIDIKTKKFCGLNDE